MNSLLAIFFALICVGIVASFFYIDFKKMTLMRAWIIGCSLVIGPICGVAALHFGGKADKQERVDKQVQVKSLSSNIDQLQDRAYKRYGKYATSLYSLKEVDKTRVENIEDLAQDEKIDIRFGYSDLSETVQVELHANLPGKDLEKVLVYKK